MAKYKPSNENQLVMLPISLQDQLVPGTLEHTINRLVDENINLSVFDERYKNDETGAAAIHPKILLKVILLAYAKGMISSRQIERACHENIIFIALSYGHARTEDCAICPLRSRCLSKSDTSRRYLSIQVDTGQPNLIDLMKAKIDSEAGKKIYARRLGIVEPVFANICVHKHMDRFTLRSKRKVDVQWRLYALVHNIGKIHVFGALI